MTSRRRVYGPAAVAILLAAVGAIPTLQAEQTREATVTKTQTTSAASTTTKQPVDAAKPVSGKSAAKVEEHDRPLVLRQSDDALKWTDCPALFPPGCKIAVLHGDPAKPGVDVFLRVPGGYTIPAHWHTSAERMVLVSGNLDVTYAGHPTARLETNDYAYGPAKLPHVAKCLSKTPCTLFIAFDTAMDAQPFQGDLGEKS